MEDQLLDPHGPGREESSPSWTSRLKGVYYQRVHDPVMNVLKVYVFVSLYMYVSY